MFYKVKTRWFALRLGSLKGASIDTKWTNRQRGKVGPSKKCVSKNLRGVYQFEVEYSNLVGCELNAEMAKFMIDEYPILSIAAAFAKGTSIFRGLKELKVKESDRLELIRLNLVNCGCDCQVINDDLIIYYQHFFNNSTYTRKTKGGSRPRRAIEVSRFYFLG